MEFDVGRIVNWVNFKFIVGTQAWLPYSFPYWIFLQLVVQEKKYMNLYRGMNIVEIVDKMVKNLTRGRWIPIDSVKSWNYFKNCGHKIRGMGHIESDIPNPSYMIGSCLTYPGWSYLSQMRSGWKMNSFGWKFFGYILFITTITNKKKTQTDKTNKKKEKSIKPMLRLTWTKTTPNWSIIQERASALRG